MKRLLLLTLCILSAQLLAAADLTGTWSAAVVLDAGSGTATFVLTQSGETLSGTYTGTFGEAKVSGSVKGDQVELTFDNDQVGKIVYKGTMDGAAKFKGSCEYGALGKGTFTAERK